MINSLRLWGVQELVLGKQIRVEAVKGAEGAAAPHSKR